MTKQAIALIAALLVVGGLLVAGCGDDDNEASAGSPGAEGTSASIEFNDGSEADGGGELTKVAFIKEADAICAENVEEVAEEGTKLYNASKGNKVKYETKVVEEVILPSDEANIEGIESLGAPAGDEEEISTILDRLKLHVERVKEQGPVKFFEVKPDEQAEYNAIIAGFKGYGFKKCYQRPSS